MRSRRLRQIVGKRQTPNTAEKNPKRSYYPKWSSVSG
jgi:hypothetical protein